MVISNVVSINKDTARSGDQSVNEEQIRYAWADPADPAGQTYLHVSKGKMNERWLVSDAIATIISDMTTEVGREVLIAATLVKFNGFARTGAFAFAARNVIEMRDDDNNQANIWIGDEGTDKPIKVVVSQTSASLATDANSALAQITSVNVQRINGIPNSNAVQATASALMKLETVTLQGAGTGYTPLDVLTLVGGTGTPATIRVDTVGGGGDIATFTVLTTGSYSALPGTAAVAVTGGTGTLATFNLDYEVNSFTITNAGSGYDSATLTVTGGGGAAATGTVTVAGGIVTVLTQTAPGNNFTSMPTVTISTPNGNTISFSNRYITDIVPATATTVKRVIVKPLGRVGEKVYEVFS